VGILTPSAQRARGRRRRRYQSLVDGSGESQLPVLTTEEIEHRRLRGILAAVMFAARRQRGRPVAGAPELGRSSGASRAISQPGRYNGQAHRPDKEPMNPMMLAALGALAAGASVPASSWRPDISLRKRLPVWVAALHGVGGAVGFTLVLMVVVQQPAFQLARQGALLADRDGRPRLRQLAVPRARHTPPNIVDLAARADEPFRPFRR
jgi:hypothetical protein